MKKLAPVLTETHAIGYRPLEGEALPSLMRKVVAHATSFETKPNKA